MAETPKPRNGVATLKTWWPIILFVASLCITWGVFMTRVDVLADEQATIRSDAAASGAQNTEILVQLAAIQRDIVWIREQLSRGGGQ